jgi:hypothetical protein
MRYAGALVFDADSRFPALLEVSVTTTVTLSFFDRAMELLVADDLRDYRTLQIHESTEQGITLIGSGATPPRTFLFEAADDFGAFFSLFADGATGFQLSPVAEDPRTFVLRAPPRPTIAGALRQVAVAIDGLRLGPSPQRPADGICSGLILPALPSVLAPVVGPEAAQALDLAEIDWGSQPIAPGAWPVIWGRFLSRVGGLAADYAQVKKQWEALTLGQWENWQRFRFFVRDMDDLLAATDFPKRLFFDVLATAFTEVFGAVRSPEALLFVGQAMFLVFVRQESDREFEFTDGRVLPELEAASFLFGSIREVMAALFKEIPKRKMLDDVRKRLAEISPSTLAMVENRGPSALEELVDHTQLMLMEGRRPYEALVLMAQVVARGDIAAFRRDLLCVVLALLHERLQKVPPEPPGPFMSTFESETWQLDPRLLALNIARLERRPAD